MDEQTKLRYLKDIEYFSAKIEKDPKSKVFMPLALAYLKLGKYDEVVEVCQRGLDYNPDYIAAKTIMAQAFLEKGLLEEAKGLLIEVATLNKSNYRANKLLGEIYRAEENMEKAIYYYRTALHTSPEDKELKKLIEELAEVVEPKPATLEEIEFEEKESIKEEKIEESEDDLLEQASNLSKEIEHEVISEQESNIEELDESAEVFEGKSEEEDVVNEIVIPDEPVDDLMEDFLIDEAKNEEDDINTESIDLENNLGLDQNENKDEDELDIFGEDFGIDTTSLDDDSISIEESSDEFLSSLGESEESSVDSDETKAVSDLNEKTENIDTEDEFENILDEKIDAAVNENTVEEQPDVSVEINKAAVERLEGWLKNIEKVKSNRNV